MSLCEDLYRDIILDHYSHPRHKGALAQPTHREEGMNPLCGDEVALELRVEDGKVAEVGFTGHGCSISQASASMCTELIVGQEVARVRELIEAFRQRMTTRGESPPCALDMGDLEALDGVRQYPVRIKCALLAWTTLLQALETPIKGDSHG